MPVGLLEAWVKGVAAWQLRQFGNLAVQEDLRLVEEELETRRRLEAPRSEAPRSEALRYESDHSTNGDGQSDVST